MTTTAPIPGHSEQPAEKPRRRRRWPWVLLAAVVCLTIGLIIGAGGSPTPTDSASVTPATSAPASDHASSPPTGKPAEPTRATRIRFVINGQIPAAEFGQVDINYGSNHHTHNVTLPSLDGKLTYTMPYRPGADYYSLDVDWSGPGHATARIVVLTNNGAPLTVSHGEGSASGTYGAGSASAQATPNNSAGTSWYDES